MSHFNTGGNGESLSAGKQRIRPEDPSIFIAFASWKRFEERKREFGDV